MIGERYHCLWSDGEVALREAVAQRSRDGGVSVWPGCREQLHGAAGYRLIDVKSSTQQKGRREGRRGGEGDNQTRARCTCSPRPAHPAFLLSWAAIGLRDRLIWFETAGLRNAMLFV